MDKVVKRFGYIYGIILYRTPEKKYYFKNRIAGGAIYVSVVYDSHKMAMDAKKANNIEWMRKLGNL